MNVPDEAIELICARGPLDLDCVARVLAKHCSADGCIAFLVSEDGRELRVGGTQPRVGSDTAALRIPVGFGVTGRVAANGHAVRLDFDSPRNPVHRRLLAIRPGETISRICLPLRGLDEVVLGVASVFRRSGDPFTDEDLPRAQQLADLIGHRLHEQKLAGKAAVHRSERDELIAQAISAQEAERRRIAGDLHDGVTQALASMAFHLSSVDTLLHTIEDSYGTAAAAARELDAARRLARLAYDETRSAISGLHSLILDDLGLVAALESLAHSVPQLQVELRTDSEDAFGDVPDHCAAALYRMAQEAINNAVKHSGTDRAVVSLRRVSDLVVLGVTDDGRGFDVSMARTASNAAESGDHYGLSSIAERCALIGAALRVESSPGRGTAVIVELRVPLTR